MSLILDALRKLERERETPEAGVTVVGAVPWGEASRSRRTRLAAGAGIVLGLAVALAWLLRRDPQTPVVEPHAPAASPVGGSSPTPPATSPHPRSIQRALTPPSTQLAPAPPTIRLSRPQVSGAPSRPRVTPAPEPASVSPAATPESVAAEPDESRTSPPSSPAEAAAEAADEAPPAPAAAAAPAELRLNAISQRDGRPVALINDRLVFEGDSFEGVRVIRIGDTEVEVEVNGQRRVLRF